MDTTRMENKELLERIQSAINDLLPFLQEDGGGIEFVKFEDDTKTLELRMTGACKNCPMHLMTFRAGIERYILHKVPEVRRIEEVR
jgi:Fe-S cluster biogenesis protein NfuA